MFVSGRWAKRSLCAVAWLPAAAGPQQLRIAWSFCNNLLKQASPVTLRGCVRRLFCCCTGTLLLSGADLVRACGLETNTKLRAPT